MKTENDINIKEAILIYRGLGLDKDFQHDCSHSEVIEILRRRREKATKMIVVELIVGEWFSIDNKIPDEGKPIIVTYTNDYEEPFIYTGKGLYEPEGIFLERILFDDSAENLYMSAIFHCNLRWKYILET